MPSSTSSSSTSSTSSSSLSSSISNAVSAPLKEAQQALSSSSMSQSFSHSNSAIGQVAYLILVCIFFVLLLRVCLTVIGWIMGSSHKVSLIRGMVDAKEQIVIPQDPSISGARPLPRSTNENEGIECTWSVWIYIDDLTYRDGFYRCVFYKGNDFKERPNVRSSSSSSSSSSSNDDDSDAMGLNFPNNSPGIYLAPNTNTLVILVNTYTVIGEQITIPDIPMNKWVNIILKMHGQLVDIYINGVITKSHQLHGVLKQNYGNIYVAPNGGFSGYISDLTYYDYALGTREIAQIQRRGASLTMSGLSALGATQFNQYLSLRWYL